MEASFAIVVVGYNRIDSMLRTIDSVNRACYGEDKVDLIISLDNCGNDSVVKATDSVEWNHGEKIVRHFVDRQGLKKHILSCGDYLNNYRAIAVLEDDIIVAPGFYYYMKSAVSFYENDDNIAGISLYGFEWNPIGNAPFAPMKSRKDNYFINFAQSWGQIWMKKQWDEFKEWYLKNEDVFEKEYDGLIPKSVYGWSNKSWLKYHIRYCAEKKKYFVYPYDSLSTNAGEIGEHYAEHMTRYQVSLQHDIVSEYNFVAFNDDDAIKYDAFFENESIARFLANHEVSDYDADGHGVDDYSNIIEANESEIEIDFYGLKSNFTGKKYLLTTQLLDKKIVKKFGLSMRPQEDNIFFDIPGNEIFLYDLGSEESNKKKKSKQIYDMWNYYSHEKFVLLNEAIPVARRKFANLIRSLKK